MTTTVMRITVAPDGAISGQTIAGQLSPGEYDISITVKMAAPRSPKEKSFTMEEFLIHNVPWDGSISLHREDMYDDDGRLR